MTRALTDAELEQATAATPDYAVLPDVSVIKIGGQSIIDRGRPAVYPIVEELAAAIGAQKVLIGTGALWGLGRRRSDGARPSRVSGAAARRAPAATGRVAVAAAVLAALAVAVVWGGRTFILADHHAVIFPGMPPYDMWQPNPQEGVIPPYRTDAGCYLVAEVFGCARMIFVKDEDGLYTANPKRDDKATFIPRITVDELIAMDLPDLIIERPVLDLMRHARHVRSVQVVNGLRPGSITRALAGEHVGTIISAN